MEATIWDLGLRVYRSTQIILDVIILEVLGMDHLDPLHHQIPMLGRCW